MKKLNIMGLMFLSACAPESILTETSQSFDINLKQISATNPVAYRISSRNITALSGPNLLVPNDNGTLSFKSGLNPETAGGLSVVLENTSFTKSVTVTCHMISHFISNYDISVGHHEGGSLVKSHEYTKQINSDSINFNLDYVYSSSKNFTVISIRASRKNLNEHPWSWKGCVITTG